MLQVPPEELGLRVSQLSHVCRRPDAGDQAAPGLGGEGAPARLQLPPLLRPVPVPAPPPSEAK